MDINTSTPNSTNATTVKSLHPYKKSVINIMIGSLIGSAVIAVAAVLVGDFNSLFGKALFTLLVVAVHALACLSFIANREKTDDFNDLKLFTNTIFVLIVMSFVTLTFGIWHLMSGVVVGKLYGTYLIIAFATLHGEVLFKTT